MIRIYITLNCEYCKEAKEYLDSKNVEYREIDMSKGGIKETIEMKKRFKRLGLKTYPIIIVNHKGEELIFPKFDEGSLDKILKNES